MAQWKHTNCVICGLACGLEVEVEDNRIISSRGDAENPRTKGHACRKGRNIKYFQDSPDRTRYPLKRVGENEYERITWDQAFEEIAARLKEIVGTYGPRAIAGSNMIHFSGTIQTVMGMSMLGVLGSQYHYCDLAAELTGVWWSLGSILGRQDYVLEPDTNADECEMFIASGWNGYISHNIHGGKRTFSRFAKDPKKLLVTIDPRKSETALISDKHYAIRQGTDALLWRAITAIILKEDWYDKEYVKEHVADFEQILPWFEDVDIRESISFCGLDYDEVYEFARLIATKRTGLHSDLGVICGRHSTLTTHIQHVCLAITGNMLLPGTNVYSVGTTPYASHTETRTPDNWRTVTTDFPAIFGIHPTAVMAEEIESDHPERLRALIIGAQNPLRSVVDTPRLKKAFERLDLLVTIDPQMTETALASDYILPSQTGYESYDTFDKQDFPHVIGQIHKPVVKPEYERLYAGDIYLGIIDKLGVLPPLPQELYDAAKGSRLDYKTALLGFLEQVPQLKPLIFVIIAKTLGPVMGSTPKAIYWGQLQLANEISQDAFERMGYKKGFSQGEEVFQAVACHPEGVIVGKTEYEDLFKYLETPDKKLHLFAPELNEWMYEITPQREAEALHSPQYPLVLNTGRHYDYNMNFTMRDPDWIKGRANPETLLVNPEDAQNYGLRDGDIAIVSTNKGQIEAPVSVTKEINKGSLMIPHGIGLRFKGVETGIDINKLTDVKNRDRFAATPFIRYVPCNVRAKETVAREVNKA